MASAGGRAQIILWKLNLTQYEKPNCIELSTYYEQIDRNTSEMRIMDMIFIQFDEIWLFSACSDGNLKIFHKINDKLMIHHNIFYKFKCIMKLLYLNNDHILITMASDGYLVFWNVNDLINLSNNYLKSIKTHQSGINSCSYVKLSNNYLILTGGDDNLINLLLINIKNNDINILDQVQLNSVHCSQITGVYIVNNYFLSISIDQKLCLFQYSVKDTKVTCNFLHKLYTNISDVQGLNCLEKESDFHIFLYGNGIEYIICK